MKEQKIVAYSGSIDLSRIGDADPKIIIREALAKTLNTLALGVTSGHYDESLPETFDIEICIETERWDVQVKVTLEKRSR